MRAGRAVGPGRLLRGLVLERDWRIVILDQDVEEVLSGSPLTGTEIAPPTRDVYWADPFPALDPAGGLWIFCEEFGRWRGLGRIVALRIKDSRVIERRVVLSGHHHYAFPQVHQLEGRWLATTDTCAPYATVFTFSVLGQTWRPTQAVLPSGLCDPALAMRPEGDWLLTCTSRDEATTYEAWVGSSDMNSWRIQEGSRFQDAARARGGGSLDLARGVRVAQDCSTNYGVGVEVYATSPDGVAGSSIRSLRGADLGAAGTHTLAWTPDGSQVVADVWSRRPRVTSAAHRVREASHYRTRTHSNWLTSPTRLAVIENRLPAYRVPFYERAIRELAASGFNVTVFAGQPDSSVAQRMDEAPAPWLHGLSTKQVSLKHHSLSSKKLQPLKAFDPNLVILNQHIGDLEAYHLLLSPASRASAALWGHGRTYSTRQGSASAALKQFLTRRAQWFFAYTQAGADHVVAHGFPRTRVSVLNNTIDTDTLTADLACITNDDVEAFQRRYDLTSGCTALFLGGVDSAKGIDFLLESAGQARRLLPGFVLLVVGAGQDLSKVRAAQAAGAPVRALGRLDGVDKALTLRAADILAIPEWIGLVAVDSLVAGRPIASTYHASHSPEHEYLVPGTTAVFADHEVGAYATAMTDLLCAETQLRAMQRRCVEESPKYNLDRMVANFVEGVTAWDEIWRVGL